MKAFHQLMPEKGYVLPGKTIVGTDSHTTTYGALGALQQALVQPKWLGFHKGNIWMKVPMLSCSMCLRAWQYVWARPCPKDHQSYWC